VRGSDGRVRKLSRRSAASRFVTLPKVSVRPDTKERYDAYLRSDREAACGGDAHLFEAEMPIGKRQAQGICGQRAGSE
jgi:hypothetical protein